MPTYEYACSSCQHAWELEQSIKADPVTECPSCHQQTAKRQISRGTGFILKGGGWYADLYSAPSNKSSGGASSGSSSDSGSGSSGSSTSSGGTSSTSGSAPAASESTTKSTPAADA